ncbi:hypothetical protein N658DRAFT_252019 [Parathielavia hyrcaniae]|uniref:Uncharacterized protein n=1 Tax=Parathielavia hyrcaniae TaxID=113614 RepID=A0AAN6PU73_9PEZI|nr:hypothetical protein N658DRAFT_252019 [Parathielavia hyrcaniae]
MKAFLIVPSSDVALYAVQTPRSHTCHGCPWEEEGADQNDDSIQRSQQVAGGRVLLQERDGLGGAAHAKVSVSLEDETEKAVEEGAHERQEWEAQVSGVDSIRKGVTKPTRREDRDDLGDDNGDDSNSHCRVEVSVQPNPQTPTDRRNEDRSLNKDGRSGDPSNRIVPVLILRREVWKVWKETKAEAARHRPVPHSEEDDGCKLNHLLRCSTVTI